MLLTIVLLTIVYSCIFLLVFLTSYFSYLTQLVNQTLAQLARKQLVSQNKVVLGYSNQSHWRTVGPEQEMVVVQVQDVLLPVWEAGSLIYPCHGNIRTIGGREQKNDYKRDLTYALPI